MKHNGQILPRILRQSSAPAYLGMCRDEFNKTVRPYVKEFPIGVQGVGFDRYELDEWADRYIAENAIDKARGRAHVSSRASKPIEKQRAKQTRTEFEAVLEMVRRKK